MKKNFKGRYALYTPFLKCKTLRFALMLATLLICVSSFQLQAADTAKDVMVSVRFENASFREVLSYIEENSKYRFFYNNRTLNSANSVTMSISGLSMDKALLVLLREAGLSFKIFGEQVVLKRKRQTRGVSEVFGLPDLTSFPEANAPGDSNHFSISPVDYTISGRVTSETGESLPGVNIVVKGTTIGTTTDADGQYRLSVADGSNPVLIFSFIGYKSKEIQVTEQTVIDVSMEPDIEHLSEVVVVGYGTQKQVNVIGSVTTIDNEEITAAPVSNISNALAGRLPGAIVQQSSGEPGNNAASILIRGKGTLGNSAPLIVIDGIPERDLNSVNPNDVESITVLKDASAAIYGARAANGVILVTTKRGQEETPATFSYDFNQGLLTPTMLPEMADAATYAQMIREMQSYRGIDESNMTFSLEDIEKYKSGEYPTDWIRGNRRGHNSY